jgi:hypothetical protein
MTKLQVKRPYLSHARAVTFLGHGMAKGVNYTDIGRALIILRGSNGLKVKDREL